MKQIQDIVRDHIARTASFAGDHERMMAEAQRFEARMAKRLQADPALSIFVRHYAEGLAAALLFIPDATKPFVIKNLLHAGRRRVGGRARGIQRPATTNFMNDTIQFIRKKCVDANPEIIGLQFGCRVKFLIDTIGGDPVAVWHDSVVISEFGLCTVFDATPKVRVRGVEGMISCDDHHCEIIGRPIRLADVLLAIQASNSKHQTKWYAISSSGTFLKNKVEEITARPFAHPMISALYGWNLRADDLEKQSEETINFIYELLK